MKEISGPTQSIFIGKAIYLTDFYDTRIQKISLDGDSLWCRKLTSNYTYNLNINNITGSTNGLIAISGRLSGTLKDGNDTILQTSGYKPFVAVLEDIDSTTNINAISKNELNFTIFPNPTSSTFTIITNNKEPIQITIYNTIGEKILEHTLNRKQETINLSSQPKGVYFIEIVSEGKREMRKIVLD